MNRRWGVRIDRSNTVGWVEVMKKVVRRESVIIMGALSDPGYRIEMEATG